MPLDGSVSTTSATTHVTLSLDPASRAWVISSTTTESGVPSAIEAEITSSLT